MIVVGVTYCTTRFDANLAETAIWIAAARSFAPTAHLIYSAIQANLAVRKFLSMVVVRVSIPMFVGLMVIGVSMLAGFDPASFADLIIRTLCFSPGIALVSWLGFQQELSEDLSLIGRRLERTQA